MRKITPKSSSKRRGFDASKDENANAESREDDPSVARKQHISKQMHETSKNQYIRGVECLQQNMFEEARECFEDALASRLVPHGPESDEVLATHHQLKYIAHQQGDVRKTAHHKARIAQIQNTRLRQKYKKFVSDQIDWSVLANEY